MNSTTELTDACQQQATEHGFDVCGFAPVDVNLRKDYYEQWIADQKHGDMEWMTRNNQRRLDPSQVLPEAKTIVSLGMNYYQEVPNDRARIARDTTCSFVRGCWGLIAAGVLCRRRPLCNAAHVSGSLPADIPTAGIRNQPLWPSSGGATGLRGEMLQVRGGSFFVPL